MMIDDMAEFLEKNKIDIAALTLPAAGAEEVAPLLAAHGVRGIWNFAHTDLDLPGNIVVQSVHLSESLMELSYNLNHMD